MATNGMTINGLNPLSALTADDKIPVWDTGASGEPTKEITAQNMANSVKSLANLPNTTEMNTAIAQSTANYLVKSTYFSVAGDGGNYTIHAQNAFIVSAKNEADTINGCAVFVANLGGALRRTDIYGGNLVDVTYSDGSLTITNRAGSWATFMVFYS